MLSAHYKLCRKILSYLNSLPDSYFELSYPGSPTGKPDITGCIEGLYIAVEVKIGKDKLSPIQKHYRNKIRKAGAVCMEARSLESVKAALKRRCILI